jgi:type I restriction enzyme M protein
MARRISKKKATAVGNGGAGSVADLNRELFQAAVNLRGSIEPADYKRYVLPIIFLRFLSLRYERRREQLERLLADPKSDYYTKNPKAAAQVLEDPDEYRSAGAFIVAPQARWENIVKQAQADDIKVRLDNVLELLEKTYPGKLRGLINLFSKDIFKQDHGGEDLIGRVYEYFIGEFANSEGKRGGEYFTPSSIVRMLVAMLEPTHGVVFDPCCGSGGMFVQSDLFTKHNRQLSFVGQESKDFTYRLCRMNLFIHGIDGKIELGNSYTDDQHAGLRADYLLANPPFNDGAKGENGWGGDKIPDKDPRLVVGGEKMPLSPRNANTMWIMHFLYHLKETGTAGFVMATGELSNSELARMEVRKALVEHDYVDCIVQLTGQLFANTQIPCALWFLSKNRRGAGGYRKRDGEILFIDGRRLGALIPGSRKQKQLSDEELERVASVYRQFKHSGVPGEVPGFCKVATLDEVRGHKYALTPGRYVGAADAEADDEPFEEKLPRLTALLREQMKQSAALDKEIEKVLAEVDNGR